MPKSISEENLTGILPHIRSWVFTHRALLVRRFVVLLLLLYLSIIVDVGSIVHWDQRNRRFEFYFPTPGYSLFPFPFKPSQGDGCPQVFCELNTIESFIFLVFLYQGVWVIWMFLGITYIVMPIPLFVYTTLKKNR
nr:MAG: hypothetical protein AM325_09260 [Candidatus Thorarchaeota archaeon SMTZ1-45]